MPLTRLTIGRDSSVVRPLSFSGTRILGQVVDDVGDLLVVQLGIERQAEALGRPAFGLTQDRGGRREVLEGPRRWTGKG